MSRSKALTGLRRRRPLAAIVASLAVAVAALLVAAGASGAPTIPDNTYLFGPHQGANSMTFNHEAKCDVPILPGQVDWHFVLPQTTAENTAQLEAVFQNAGQLPVVTMTKHKGGVIHWDVITTGDDILLDAWTDATSSSPSQPPDADPPRQIRLSHVCGGGGGTQFDATLATNVHDASHVDVTGSSVALGTSIHDLATVTPGTGTVASGTVHFALYKGLDCGDTGTLKDSVDVALGTDNTPTPGEPSFSSLQATTTPRQLGAGDYSYSVSADLTSGIGQPLFVMADACEPFTVNQSQLQMDSQAHDSNHVDKTNSSVPLGSVMHDTGKITGGAVSGFDTEPITFKYYANGTCDGDGSPVANTGADEGDATRDRSAASNALGAGSYSYKAFVAGNNNYKGADSGCEPFTVNQSQLQMDSQVHNASHVDKTNSNVPLGSIMHDTGKITGGAVAGFATEPITFKYYANGTCDGDGSPVANTGADEGDATRDRSAASNALGAGSYSYKAFVAGNTNYIGSDSGCEPFTVDKGTVTIRTDIHNALHQVILYADAGAIVHDTATLGGATAGFNPTLANITFTFWSGNNGCSGPGTTVAQGTAEGTYVARTVNSAALAVGLYSYRASFSADSNYNATGNSDCEPLQIFSGALTIGYWGNHLAPTGTTGCNSVPNGTSCGGNGPMVNAQLPKTICVSASCPNGIGVGTLGATRITTFQQAALVFKNNNCNNSTSSDGNAASCLAAQLLGAELNIANGANPCACATIKAAIALLTAVNYNPATNTSNFTGSGYTRQNAIDLKTKLDNYNNAKGCPA